MPRQERALATHESIIQAGARLFARKHYDGVRIAELLQESGVTQGGFYFHFPEGKKDVAEELIRRQDGRFAHLRDQAITHPDTDGLSALIGFLRAISDEITKDIVMRAGLRLVIQASEHFPEVAHMPHPSWNQAIEGALVKAQADGSLLPDVDTSVAAKALVLLFIGAQTSSFITDQWETVSPTADLVISFVLGTLAPAGYVPSFSTETP